MYMKEASALFRLLGDEARLRLLRLLATERLNVTELTGILGIAQSGVSRHLGLLRDSGLVEERREGGFTYYQVPPAESRNGTAPLWQLLDAEFAASAGDAAARADRARLKEVLRLRKESFAECTATVDSSCRGAAGRHGPGRSATCCRRGTSRTSGAAKGI